MAQICLVEDEQKVAAFICKGLEEQGYKIKTAKNGTEARQLAAAESFDLFVIDVMLPDMNGIELCRQIRTMDKQTPILILSALDQVQNKVAGLKAGADDYLIKPFHFSELLARIEALLRRQSIPVKEEHTLVFDDLKLDTWSNIAEQVWGIDFDTGTNFIDVYVNYLRKKIEKGFKKKLIHTVIGMGYTLRNDR
ncbi:MAG: response regulator transcription factor [Mucilaginibacter sp.]